MYLSVSEAVPKSERSDVFHCLLGALAQEAVSYLPEASSWDKDGYRSDRSPGSVVGKAEPLSCGKRGRARRKVPIDSDWWFLL